MFSGLFPIVLLGLAANLEPGTLVVFVALLTTSAPRRNAVAFLAGWIVSLAVVFGLSYFVFRGEPPIHGSTEELLVQAGEIVIAGLLAWLAVHEWRRRDGRASVTSERASGWLERVGPRTAFFTALWEQPWTITAAAAMVVVRLHPPAVHVLALFVAFAAASTASVATVWVLYRRDPARVQDALHRLEAWVRRRGPGLFAVVAALASAAFLADGLHGLLTR